MKILDSLECGGFPVSFGRTCRGLKHSSNASVEPGEWVYSENVEVLGDVADERM